MLVPLGKLQKKHLLSLLVNVVQQAVGANAKAVLRGELRYDELSCELFRPFSFRPGIGCE